MAKAYPNSRLASWLNLTNDAIVVRDVDGCVRFWNRGAERCYGWTRSEAMGQREHDLLRTQWKESLAAATQQLIRNGIWEGELQQSSKEGCAVTVFSRWFLESRQGEAIGTVLEFNTNITLRKEVESELKRSEERLRLATTAARLAVWECDLTDGKVTWTGCLDPIAAFHSQASESISRRLLDLVDTADRERVMAEITATLNGGSFGAVEFRTTSDDGVVRHFSAEFGPEQAGTRATRIFGVLRDITGRKLLEEQLAIAQRLELVGRLAGGVAHDFNNLLTVILGCAESALLQLAPGTAAREEVDGIVQAATRAAALTRQLLGFGRKQVSNPREIDVNEIVETAKPVLASMLGNQIELTTRSSLEPVIVHMDPTQLEQVLINLASNAGHAMPGGGKLTITVESVGGGQDPLALVPEGEALITVEDTGVGMSDEVRRRLFEPFFSTKAVGVGTGLGLATCQAIVQQAGGRVWGEPSSSGGSVFRVALPLVAAPAMARQKQPSVEPLPRGQESILLVEDDSLVSRVVAAQLRRLGYSVMIARDGSEALATDPEALRSVDLVIADIIMPGMSGREVVERLRERGYQFKALFVSGFSEGVIAQHGILDPDVHFLPKPFSAAGLAHSIREVLDRPR